MKKTMCLLGMMLMPFALMAQGAGTETAGTVIDVTTFTGMMAIVTAIVTQLCKVVPAIAGHKWAKVLTSLGVGVAATMACWALHVSDYLEGLVWWQAAVAGVAVGLSAAGFYDVVRALWSIFKPKNEDTITYNGVK